MTGTMFVLYICVDQEKRIVSMYFEYIVEKRLSGVGAGCGNDPLALFGVDDNKQHGDVELTSQSTRGHSTVV